MAKTTSQIIAENKIKRSAADASEASRNKIHQKQMAEVGAKSAARTAAVLNKAGIKTKTNPNTYEVSVDGDYTPRKKETAQRLDMQKKKEDRLEAKAPVDSAKIKKDRTKKEYDDYIASDEYKKRQEELIEKRRQEEIMNPVKTNVNLNPIRDEKEERLRAARDQAEAEYNASEDQKIIEQDLEAITGLSEEERRQLEAYAVGRVRDQNQTLELQGIAPTAQQEAAGLIQKYGRQRVDELAETYMRQQNAELARQVDEQARQQANEHGFWSSLATIPVNALGGVVGSVGQLQGMARSTGRYQTLDPNEVGTIGGTYSGAVRGQVQQNIEGEDPNFLRKAASIGYQGVMSAADSIARAYLGGGALGGAALAATGSFSQTMAEASERGATPAQAALLATTTAGIEALSEKIPLDNLIRTAKGGSQTVMQMVKTALMQAGIEATTEEISLLGTVLADAAIMQEKSEYQLSITSKIMQGISPEQARDMADQELVNEAVNTALVSMASGGMSSLGGSAVAQYQQNRAEAMANPAVNKPKNTQQATQTAIENNRARQERMAAEEAAQESVQPQTEAQPVQKTDGELVQDTVANIVRQKQAAEAQTEQAPAQNQREETSDYEDEFENWGRDPNREGVADPMADRKTSEVGKRSVKAYMYENPDVKPFYQEQAAWMLSELSDSTKGERTYNEQLHYESGGEKGWSGNKRHTSDSIAQLLDEEGMSYEQIERGLNAIINDNGQENNAASKRIELIINDRLMNGYTDFYTGKRVEGNADYLNTLRKQQSAEQIQATSDTKQASAPTADMQMGASNQSAEGGQIKGTGAAEQNFTGKAAYQDLLQEGNVQRDRPGDVRPVEVPKTDTQGRKVSETVGNFYGAAVTSDEMANRIEELVQDGALSYDTRTNKQSLENASAEITKRGEESVRADIAKNIGQNKIQDGDIEKALLLYAKDANDPNRQEAAAEMMVQLQEMATMSGRNLQLFRLVRRMTPEGQLMTVQKDIRRNAEKMVKSGSVKKGFEPAANTELEQEYMKAAKDAKNAKTDKARQEAEASMKELQDAMYLDAAAQMPSTFKAKWDAWRYMAMLGNAKTQVRNVVGNAAFKPYKEVKDKMGALAEKLFVPKDQRTKSLITDHGLIQWARNDRKNNAEVQDALKYSASIGDDVSVQKTRENMQVFNSKALEGVRKFVEGVPQAGDMLFKSNYYERSLAGFLKARGYTAADIQNGKVSEVVLNEARSYAVQEAMKATFNDSNAFSDFMATGLRYKGDNPIGKAMNLAAEGVLPFRRTPANIAVRFTEYSPVGVAKGLWNAATKVRNGEMTAATAIDQLSSGLTGSAVMALGFALAGGLNGIKITGSGTDEDEKRQGHQDYALEFSVDGQEYSYKIDWAAPANLPLFVGANIYSALENAGEDTDVSKFTSFIRGMGTMFEPLLALSCMSSLNDLVEGVRYAEEGEALYSMAANAATSYFTQGIPALLRQSYQATQENKQTTFANSNDPTIRDMQTTAAGLPFVGDKYQTDKINAWGEKENMGDGVTRAVNAFLNPGTLKKIDNSEVEQEITRLNKVQDESVTPPYISKVITYTDSNGDLHKDYRLSEEEYTKIATTQGQTARRIIETMLDSKNYQAMSDSEKAKAIKQVYSYAREKGMVENIEGHTGYSESWMMEMREGKESEEILRRITNSELNRTMTNLDSAWDNGYNTEARSRELAAAYDSYSKMTADQKRKVRDFATGTTAKYIEAREKGVTHDNFLKTAKAINNAKGTGAYNEKTGKNTVREIDKRKIIAQSGLSEKDIDRMMMVYMEDYDPNKKGSETSELKYNYIRQELGLSPSEYVKAYEVDLKGGKWRDIRKGIQDALGCDWATANSLLLIFEGQKKSTLVNWYNS